jgi:hypothetical protein
MKTREQIYGKEAAGLLRVISMYPGLKGGQLCRFYPEKGGRIPTVLSSLQKQGRICANAYGEYFPGRECGGGTDGGLVRAVWVLLDFIDKVEFHSAGEFPVKVIFFADGEMYEIVHAAKGQEALVTHVLDRGRGMDGKRVVLVDEPQQVARLDVAASGFCTVDAGGRVQYYKRS